MGWYQMVKSNWVIEKVTWKAQQAQEMIDTQLNYRRRIDEAESNLQHTLIELGSIDVVCIRC